MNYRQLFFIEGKLLAEATRKQVMCHETLREPSSDLYFCGICGEVYAKLPCLRADGSTTYWQSFRGVCRKCHIGECLWQPAGSIWKSWDNDLLAALPPQVIEVEFLKHIETFERLTK